MLISQSLIIIPGIGNSEIGNFEITSQPWRKLFFSSKPSLRSLIFRYQLKLDNQYSYHALFRLGEEFLEAVSKLRNDEPEVVIFHFILILCEDFTDHAGQTKDRPIIFICHCFGGVILKQVT